MFESINPATEQVLARYATMPAEALTVALEEARSTARVWSRVEVGLRAAMLERVADLLDAKREEFAQLITAEVGKPIAEARAELDKCALLCRYYAEHAVEFLADQRIQSGTHESVLSYEPLGAVLGIMPWNFRFGRCFALPSPS